MSHTPDDIIIEAFIQEIREKFPEVSTKLDEWMKIEEIKPEDKMYTAIFDQFSQITTDSFKCNNEEKAKHHLEYMSQKLSTANEIEKQYIDVNYVESLMWDDFSGARRKKCWDLMPENLQKLYFRFWGRKLYYEPPE